MGESDYDALIAGINTAMANIENGVEPEPDPELQAALNAAVADAQETLALRGPGYPVAEGASYNALNEAIATAQAVTYPTAAAVEALTTATHPYKCATDPPLTTSMLSLSPTRVKRSTTCRTLAPKTCSRSPLKAKN